MQCPTIRRALYLKKSFFLQSSTFRFSCLPVSRVECMLRLPSLDLVFSSKRADGEINEEFGEGGGGGSPSKAAEPAADTTSASR